jgi:hypothetical protein
MMYLFGLVMAMLVLLLLAVYQSSGGVYPVVSGGVSHQVARVGYIDHTLFF